MRDLQRHGRLAYAADAVQHHNASLSLLPNVIAIVEKRGDVAE